MYDPKQRSEAERFMPDVRKILSGILADKLAASIHTASEEEDFTRASDLILRVDSVQIGVRVRTDGYKSKYGTEMTVRATVPSRRDTELTKWINGWGDFNFYGFGNKGTGLLDRWVVVDLKAFRAQWMRLVRQRSRSG